METITFDRDITVLCVTASSFPEGVLAAHQKLHAMIPFSPERKFFGISRPENGAIVYKAAVETTDAGEAEKLSCETVVLKQGRYISLTLTDFMKDIPAIGRAFEKLLSLPGLDPQGYCVEWYFNDTDVKCMIRLA